jgi:hypothetical protein
MSLELRRDTGGFMKAVLKSLIFVFILSFGLSACGGTSLTTPSAPAELPSNAEAPLGVQELASIYLKSTNLESVASLSEYIVNEFVYYAEAEDDDETQNCHIEGGDISEDGQCLTPINMSGKASTISVASSTANGEGPARLFGSTVGAISTGQYGTLEISEFDFASPIAMQGESNVYDADDDEDWDLITVYVAYLDIQAKLKGKYWTVRYAFVDQVPSDNTTISTCVDEHYLESMEENANVLDTDTEETFQNGDLMVCIKDTATAACADTDFQWLNTDTDTLVSTRPTNPFQHEWADEAETSCDASEGEGYSIQLGGYDLYASTTAFNLSAEFEACQQMFSYTDPDTDDVSTGNTLGATFDYDMEESVFIDAVSVDGLTDAELLEAFHLKQIYLRANSEYPEAVGGEAFLSVDADIVVTQDDTITCETADEIDDEYLTGADCMPSAQVKEECTHEVCDPYFTAIDDSIWSETSAGDSCSVYCTKQTCDGTTKQIYCTPDC